MATGSLGEFDEKAAGNDPQDEAVVVSVGPDLVRYRRGSAESGIAPDVLAEIAGQPAPSTPAGPSIRRAQAEALEKFGGAYPDAAAALDQEDGP